MIKQRYRKILSFFAGILIGLLLWEVILPRLGFKKKAQLNREKRLKNAAVEYHDLAVSMGGGAYQSGAVALCPAGCSAASHYAGTYGLAGRGTG